MEQLFSLVGDVQEVPLGGMRSTKHVRSSLPVLPCGTLGHLLWMGEILHHGVSSVLSDLVHPQHLQEGSVQNELGKKPCQHGSANRGASFWHPSPSICSVTGLPA